MRSRIALGFAMMFLRSTQDRIKKEILAKLEGAPIGMTATDLGAVLDVPVGPLYPLLHELEHEARISHYLDFHYAERRGGRPRFYYTLIHLKRDPGSDGE